MGDGSTQNYTLSARQRRLVEALLGASSLVEACSIAGVSRKTAYLWLRQPEFRQALAEAQSQLIEATTRRLLALQTQAVDSLAGVLDDKLARPAEKIRAAELILANSVKFFDMTDIERRIQRLEEIVFGGGGV